MASDECEMFKRITHVIDEATGKRYANSRTVDLDIAGELARYLGPEEAERWMMAPPEKQEVVDAPEA